jgi:hypothetical protein
MRATPPLVRITSKLRTSIVPPSTLRLSTSVIMSDTQDRLKTLSNLIKSDTHNLKSSTFSELTNDQIASAVVPVNPKQFKAKSLNDLVDFTDRLFIEGLPGLSDFKDHKPYIPYRDGSPSVPPPLMHWFRGHHYPARDLLPSVHRFKELPENNFEFENPLLPFFQMKNPEFRHLPICETLSIMQHYGYPTRYLDWSSNIMSAAYFACQPDHRHDTHDGVIWILSPFKLNMNTTLSDKNIGLALSNSFDAQIRSYQSITDTYDELIEYADTLWKSKNRPKGVISFNDTVKYLHESINDYKIRKKMSYSIAVNLGYPNRRIEAQKGMFTIAGGKQYFARNEIEAQKGKQVYDSPVSLFYQDNEIQQAKSHHDRFLQCILIDAPCKEVIRRQLNQILDINASSQMQDLDAFGRDARALFEFRRKF